ncbi:hypothetical protein HK102_005432, partial [Quaeritorhiza haematococci]
MATTTISSAALGSTWKSNPIHGEFPKGFTFGAPRCDPDDLPISSISVDASGYNTLTQSSIRLGNIIPSSPSSQTASSAPAATTNAPGETSVGDKPTTTGQDQTPADTSDPEADQFRVYAHTLRNDAFLPHKDGVSVSKGKLLDVALYMDRTVFSAGGELAGRLEIRSRSQRKVKLGLIYVELVGYEEILDSRVTPTSGSPKPLRRAFLKQTATLQSTDLAPTDAVNPGTPDEHGMWLARKGTTVFEFSIPIHAMSNVVNRIVDGEGGVPLEGNDVNGGGEGAKWKMFEKAAFPLPSSYWNKKFGGVRYIVSSMVYHKIQNEYYPPLVAYREIQVLEQSEIPIIPSAVNPFDRRPDIKPKDHQRRHSTGFLQNPSTNNANTTNSKSSTLKKAGSSSNLRTDPNATLRITKPNHETAEGENGETDLLAASQSRDIVSWVGLFGRHIGTVDVDARIHAAATTPTLEHVIGLVEAAAVGGRAQIGGVAAAAEGDAKKENGEERGREKETIKRRGRSSSKGGEKVTRHSNSKKLSETTLGDNPTATMKRKTSRQSLLNFGSESKPFALPTFALGHNLDGDALKFGLNELMPSCSATGVGTGANVHGVWVAGGIGFVNVNIQNGSYKKISKLDITLIRRLKTFSVSTQGNPIHCSFSRMPIAKRSFIARQYPGKSGRSVQVTSKGGLGGGGGGFDTVSMMMPCGGGAAAGMGMGLGGVESEGGGFGLFGGGASRFGWGMKSKAAAWWAGVPAGETRKLTIDLMVPPHARSVRFGKLIEVSYVVQIAVTPSGNKPIEVEIPVTILHPISTLFSAAPYSMFNPSFVYNLNEQLQNDDASNYSESSADIDSSDHESDSEDEDGMLIQGKKLDKAHLPYLEQLQAEQERRMTKKRNKEAQKEKDGGVVVKDITKEKQTDAKPQQPSSEIDDAAYDFLKDDEVDQPKKPEPQQSFEEAAAKKAAGTLGQSVGAKKNDVSTADLEAFERDFLGRRSYTIPRRTPPPVPTEATPIKGIVQDNNKSEIEKTTTIPAADAAVPKIANKTQTTPRTQKSSTTLVAPTTAAVASVSSSKQTEKPKVESTNLRDVSTTAARTISASPSATTSSTSPQRSRTFKVPPPPPPPAPPSLTENAEAPITPQALPLSQPVGSILSVAGITT